MFTCCVLYSKSCFVIIFQAKERLKEVKWKYLQYLALYDELREMILDFNIKKHDMIPSSNTTEVC